LLDDLWNVFRQGRTGRASELAEAARRDSRHTDAQLHAEVLRLESKIDGLALICQALFEILRDRGGIEQAEVEAKIADIDLRGGHALAPVASIEEARERIAAHAGPAESFRLPLADGLQDPMGLSMAIITDAILKRGWEPDGYTQEKGFRIYRYKTLAASR